MKYYLKQTLISKKKLSFKPNYYEDISKFLNKKVVAMKIYKSEIKNFHFLEV